ncbi:hypothetical protein CDAR_224251 [Caerostris darwini]|uniref:Uncharacterized protein n=1 Tax=Caerostris darwini TaxID=1538125 RepID=A0AAV4QBU4_9ARAC|nr:hypothetical protein CDAR_224251 [Caerostris darwini]
MQIGRKLVLENATNMSSLLSDDILTIDIPCQILKSFVATLVTPLTPRHILRNGVFPLAKVNKSIAQNTPNIDPAVNDADKCRNLRQVTISNRFNDGGTHFLTY